MTSGSTTRPGLSKQFVRRQIGQPLQLDYAGTQCITASCKHLHQVCTFNGDPGKLVNKETLLNAAGLQQELSRTAACAVGDHYDVQR